MSGSYLLSVALLKSTVSDPRPLPIVSPGPRDSLRERSQLPTLSQEHTNTLSWQSNCALRAAAQAKAKLGHFSSLKLTHVQKWTELRRGHVWHRISPSKIIWWYTHFTYIHLLVCSTLRNILLILALMLTFAFMAVLSLCSHTRSHLGFTHMFVQWQLCTNISTQMGWTFAQCTPHTVTSSPPTGTHSLSVTQAVSHLLSALHSHTQLHTTQRSQSHPDVYILTDSACTSAAAQSLLHADENFHKGTHIPSLWVEQNSNFRKSPEVKCLFPRQVFL